MVAEDGELIIDDLAANDTDIDSTPLVVSSAGQSPFCTVLIAGGRVTFRPAKDFTGTTTFDYTVSDGVLSDLGTVTVTVTPVNDQPVTNLDVGTTPRDTAITFTNLTANDWDVED
jgi:hypothetical protein